MDELPGLVGLHGVSFLLKRTHSLVVLLDSAGRFLEWNPAFDAIKQVNSTFTSLASFVTEDSMPVYESILHVARKTGAPSKGIVRLIPNVGLGEREYDVSILPMPDGRMIFVAELVFLDPALAERYQQLTTRVSQLQVDYEQVKRLVISKQTEIEAVVAQAHEVANTDALTFLPNRRHIIGDLQREVLNSDRTGAFLSISMLDVDHFKNVNDTYGHVSGDMVLRHVATYLRDHVRSPDIVGRYGGEEFLVLLPNARLDAAAEQAERLCQQIRELIIPVGEVGLKVTVSIGVAEYHIQQEDWQKFLSRADLAMYEAKQNGRDSWAVSK